MLAHIRFWLNQRRNWRAHGVLWAKAALTSVAVFTASALFPQLVLPDHSWRDWQTIYFHRAAAPSDPVVVEIRDDPEHRRMLHQLVPTDRPFVANLTVCMARAEPRVIGIDILLAGPREEPVDPLVAGPLRKAAASVPLVLAGYDVTDSLGRVTAFRPVAALTSASGATQGNVRLKPEKPDTFVRRSYSVLPGAPISHNFPDAMLAAAGEPVEAISPGERLFWWLPESFVRLPAATIAELCERNDLPALRRLFADRIVLLGSVADSDRHRTPLSKLDRYEEGIDGVIIHADAIAHRLAGVAIYPAPLISELILGFVLSFLALRWNDRYLWRRISYGLLMTAAVLLMDCVLFALFGIALRTGLLLYCFGASILAWFLIPQWVAGRQDGSVE